MAIARNILPFDYVSLADRQLPPEQQTVFKLRPTSIADEGLAAEAMRGEHGSAAAAAAVLLRRGVVGWSNFLGADGSETPFVTDSKGLVTDAALSLVSSPDRSELVVALLHGYADVDPEAVELARTGRLS